MIRQARVQATLRAHANNINQNSPDKGLNVFILVSGLGLHGLRKDIPQQ